MAVRFPERFPVRISTGIPGEIEWSVRLSSKALHVPCRFHTPLVPLAFIFCAFNFPGNPALKEEVTSLLRREGRMKEEVRGCRKREGRSKGGRSFTGHTEEQCVLCSTERHRRERRGGGSREPSCSRRAGRWHVVGGV